MPNRLAATTTCYVESSLAEALAGIAGAGFRYVELASIRGVCEHVPLGADTKDLGRVHYLLNQYALTPVALSAHSNLTTDAGLADAHAGLELCERMGIAVMNTAVGGPEDVAEDEGLFLKNIGGLADAASARGITITLEIHGELTATGQGAKRLAEAVAHPNVRINYDTANCEYFGGVRAEDDLPHAIPWMALCHLKDKVGGSRVWDFPPLGRGHVDFPKLLAILARAGYTGPCSVEVEFQGNPLPPLETINEALKESYAYLAEFGLS
jgi:sugar phosphate isomerase/epimerase